MKSAGLTTEHVVYVQVYLEDMSNHDEMKRVFAEYFGKSQPAQAVLGVARTAESPIEINAVAVRSLAGQKAGLSAELPIGGSCSSRNAYP